MSTLKATPVGIIVDREARPSETRVVVRSTDRRAFRILGAASTLPGVSAEADDSDTRTLHGVRVKIEPGPGNRGRPGKVMIRTNHPSQSVASISVFISGHAPAMRAPTEAQP